MTLRRACKNLLSIEITPKVVWILTWMALGAVLATCRSSPTTASKSAPGGTVEVTAETDDTEDPLEFKQADESVQIGGVNLTDPQLALTATYTLRVYAVTHLGADRLILSRESETGRFNFTIKAKNYLRLEVTGPSGRLWSAVLAPSFKPFTLAHLTFNRTSTVAAKILESMSKLAQKGDQAASKQFSEWAVNVPDLTMVSASAVKVIDEQTLRGTTANALDISQIANHLVEKTAEKISGLSAVGSTLNQYASQSSRESFDSLFGSTSTGVATEILAFRAAAVGTDYEASLKAIQGYGNKFLESAWRAMAGGFRAATSVEDASNKKREVDITFKSYYTACQISPESCLSDDYTPPSAPGGGGGTTGGTTGGGSSTGGGTTGGGSGFHTVFVSSNTWFGYQLADADSKCQALGGTGTWKAIISYSGSDAKTRIAITGPIYTTTGSLVAWDAADLWDGSIANPIDRTETGQSPAESYGIWTGTSTDGTNGGFNCSNWSISTEVGDVAQGGANDSSWIYMASTPCTNSGRLYCINNQ